MGDFKGVFGFDLLGFLLGMNFRTNWYQNLAIWLRNEDFEVEGIESRLKAFEQMTLEYQPVRFCVF